MITFDQRQSQVSGKSFSTAYSKHQSKALKLDKKLAVEEFQFKIQGFTYCDELEMLSVGLANGAIANYTFDIESESLYDPKDAEGDKTPKAAKPRRKSPF